VKRSETRDRYPGFSLRSIRATSGEAGWPSPN
jgi:hypothetical protein